MVNTVINKATILMLNFALDFSLLGFMINLNTMSNVDGALKLTTTFLVLSLTLYRGVCFIIDRNNKNKKDKNE